MQKNRTVRVRLRFNNPDGKLKPNMYAQIKILGKARQNVTLIPLEAVIRTGKQNRVVLALGSGQFKSIAVEIGQVYQDSIEILDGLSSDDRIVTSAQFLIDSESSKSSDFKRMESIPEPMIVWAEGTVTAKDDANELVTIEHLPVDAWQWPQMVMDFSVANADDFALLAVGQTLHFEITKHDDNTYPITAIHIMSQASNELDTQATVKGVINQIDSANRVLNISREAIEKWGRGSATMDFEVLAGIELFELKEGEQIEFTFDTAQDFKIIAIKSIKAPENAAPQHH
jgi:Cu(I)/Ag(I) efflux system membrane fusion protein